MSHAPRRLAATSSIDDQRVVLTCSGSAETDALEQLAATLHDVHQSALRAPARQVVADVRALEFASSSCLKAFVSWLQQIQELDESQRYRVLFRSNPRHSWQRRSLGALAAFAGNVVTIETEGAP